LADYCEIRAGGCREEYAGMRREGLEIERV
jgi:hypothetical protein